MICIPNVSCSQCCLVRAWRMYASLASPLAQKQGPAFLLLSGRAHTSITLTATMRLALRASGHPNPLAVPLHSVRRGTAQACANAGDEEAVIAEAGGWRSSSMYNYVPKKILTAVPLTLSSLFG